MIVLVHMSGRAKSRRHGVDLIECDVPIGAVNLRVGHGPPPTAIAIRQIADKRLRAVVSRSANAGAIAISRSCI
ncbi:hypothetical protein [Burkholderia anthina]|uniref:hypothetical protein n=1 Tax=Burkholderia anthina TaxID=179879 RepID=UPI001AA0511B|nr:hypothetical protein [Burkholderia anthina]QTD91718.1 hypothetical protein J4G50_26035 [Burkholderia anthina]